MSIEDHRKELGLILDKLGFDEFCEQLKDAAKESDEGKLNPEECDEFVDLLDEFGESFDGEEE